MARTKTPQLSLRGLADRKSIKTVKALNKGQEVPGILTVVIIGKPGSDAVRSYLEQGWEIVASRGGHLANLPTLTLVKRGQL